ncbi:MAG: hypothetical protein K2O02_04050 [Lachnospiraceae bacterium]|nr:hypothetical protein [Lachnospiraceae bacterium]
MWPYKDISQIEFLKRLRFVEKVIEKLGAVCVGETEEKVSHISKNTIIDNQVVVKKIWKFRNQYVRIDGLYFNSKPFIVPEFSDKIEGPYEDGDSFPYDLPENELVPEMKYALGILPYPEWEKQL